MQFIGRNWLGNCNIGHWEDTTSIPPLATPLTVQVTLCVALKWKDVRLGQSPIFYGSETFSSRTQTYACFQRNNNKQMQAMDLWSPQTFSVHQHNNEFQKDFPILSDQLKSSLVQQFQKFFGSSWKGLWQQLKSTLVFQGYFVSRLNSTLVLWRRKISSKKKFTWVVKKVLWQ